MNTYEFPFDPSDDPEQRARALLAFGYLGDEAPGIDGTPPRCGTGFYSQLARGIVGSEGEDAEGNDLLFELSDPDDYDPYANLDQPLDDEDSTGPEYPDNFCSLTSVGGGIEVLPPNDDAPLPLQQKSVPIDLSQSLHRVEVASSIPAKNQNRRRPSSRYISAWQLVNVLHGIYFANEQGWPMNTELVLPMQQMGCQTDDECYHAFSRFLDRYRSKAREAGSPVVYWYCWERARDRGLHVHMQLHIPPEQQTAFREWVILTTSSLPGSGKVTGRPFVKTRRAPSMFTQYACTRYNLKGVDPQLRFRLGAALVSMKAAGIKLRTTGEIGVKRVGVSGAIGPEARRRAGYRPIIWEGGDPLTVIWTAEPLERFHRAAYERLLKELRISGGNF